MDSNQISNFKKLKYSQIPSKIILRYIKKQFRKNKMTLLNSKLKLKKMKINSFKIIKN